MLSLTDPDTSTMASPVGNRYSGCWGWYQSTKNKEYAISGSRDGTFFIDITNATAPVVCDFVPGKKGCTWREMKTYQNYCYIISDDPKPNKFQIVDMQYLPDSVHVIHSGVSYFEKGHTIWIDQDKMYIGMNTFIVGSSPMTVYSLATPTAPLLIKRLESDIPPSIINQVHDMYARNDTIYASAGWQGLFMFKHDVAHDTLITLGSYAGYNNSGYNHSSSLTYNGKTLVFCDEVPSSLPIHVIDVQNPGNMQPMSSFFPAPQCTSHNPYVLGNNFVVVSCYQDGLYIFDISQPNHVTLAGFFDTYPQGGANIGAYPGGAYAGNWGSYPFLPSGNIIANDMQNGVFVLNASKAFTSTTKPAVSQVGLNNYNTTSPVLRIFPNPSSKLVSINYFSLSEVLIQLKNILGQVVFEKRYSEGDINEYLDVSAFDNGSYFLELHEAHKSITRKLLVQH